MDESYVELLDEVQETLKQEGIMLTRRQLMTCWEVWADRLFTQLKAGGEIDLPHFGTMSTYPRGERTMRHPTTGKQLQVSASKGLRVRWATPRKRELGMVATTSPVEATAAEPPRRGRRPGSGRARG